MTNQNFGELKCKGLDMIWALITGLGPKNQAQGPNGPLTPRARFQLFYILDFFIFIKKNQMVCNFKIAKFKMRKQCILSQKKCNPA